MRHMPPVVLNMIIKNEAPVITRCLASVKHWLDHWVIVDTGCAQGIVREFMQGIPARSAISYRNFRYR